MDSNSWPDGGLQSEQDQGKISDGGKQDEGFRIINFFIRKGRKAGKETPPETILPPKFPKDGAALPLPRETRKGFMYTSAPPLQPESMPTATLLDTTPPLASQTEPPSTIPLMRQTQTPSVAPLTGPSKGPNQPPSSLISGQLLLPSPSPTGWNGFPNAETALLPIPIRSRRGASLHFPTNLRMCMLPKNLRRKSQSIRSSPRELTGYFLPVARDW